MGGWGWLEWTVTAAGFLVPAVLTALAAKSIAARIAAPARGLKRAALVGATLAAYPVVLFVFASFCIKPFFSSRVLAQSAGCQANLRRLSTALLLYAQDWDQTLPPAERWGDVALGQRDTGVDERTFRCPAATAPYGYAFNRTLGSCPLDRVWEPSTTILLFEADSRTRNRAARRRAQARYGRHSGRLNAARVDGFVFPITPSSSAHLNWENLPPAGSREAEALAAAREAVEKHDDWAREATYEVQRDGDRWKILARRITGYDIEGEPQFTPGGSRLIVVNRNGGVTGYIRGY